MPSSSQQQHEERPMEPWEWGNQPQDVEAWNTPNAMGWAEVVQNGKPWNEETWGAADNDPNNPWVGWHEAEPTWGDPDVPTWADVSSSQRQDHVDHMRHLIPFWRDSVEAAERGETLRFADFLAQFSPGGKYANDPWGGPNGWPTADGWDDDPNWGKELAKFATRAASPPRSVASGVSSRTVKTPQRSGSVAQGRDKTAKKRRRMYQKVVEHGLDVHNFVDQLSLAEHADPERMRRAHKFVDVSASLYLCCAQLLLTLASQLPADRKVQEIQRKIRELGH
jgi:hypothetical protein